mmetsp:Transcript_7347/g.17919  ORF Transcript_7347/g.17919 Transcript_7347/m.17919 type:complete len:167 (-) Transcript_7347:83-583(-)
MQLLDCGRTRSSCGRRFPFWDRTQVWWKISRIFNFVPRSMLSSIQYHDFQRYLREICVPFARIVILAYSITDRDSFVAVLPKVRDGIIALKSKAPERNWTSILVGFKADASTSDRRVSLKEAKERSLVWNCDAFLEVSSAEGTNFIELFEEIVKAESKLRRKETNR